MNFKAETKSKLEEYSKLIVKWNQKINLISKSTEANIFERHILDCAQIYDHLNADDIICDLGSGCGLPGIVLSIMGIKNTILVESDVRKSAFLTIAKNISDNEIIVKNERAENLNNIELGKIDFVISRALASIDKIFYLSADLHPESGFILLKGENYKKELEEAHKNWHFEFEGFSSITNSNSALLKIRNVRSKN
jgi:16S rRNA (guanine527-N7)-methyltransferase